MIKPILILSFLLYFAQANATSYYLSSSSGNDQLNDGNTANTAWKSISRLEKILGSLQPGDSVFFKCNDSFPGQLILSQSGSASKNIYIGSFGSGKKPVIFGTATISNWTQTITNIWEATCSDFDSNVTNFFIDSKPQQIGRWPNVTEPNKGYLTYESHSGTNSITDNELTKATDWTGAEAVVRRNRWILDRLTIKTHNVNTLVFTTDVSYSFMKGFGYFIQNDPRTLDQQGEWYYNPASKKFSLYSKTDPNTFITTATRLDNLIKITSLNYITIENLHFYGSGKLTMDIDNSNYLTIRNNDITYSGENAVVMKSSNFIIFENNLINHTNNNAFTQNYCNNFVMRNNIIKNTALIAGMGLSSDGQYNAVQVRGKNMLIEYNTIDSVGYLGMSFKGDTLIIKNNLISNYCMTKDDGGGLYTYGSESTTNYSRKLIGNILINAIGAPEGSGWSGVAAEGIYIDDRSANVDIINNSVYNCGNSGIYIHNANHVGIKGNTVYNNGIQLLMEHDRIAPTYPITNCAVDSNIFVSKKADQMVASYLTIDNDINEFGTFDYNYYCNPFDDRVISLHYVNGTKINEAFTVENWCLKYGKDKHSSKSPVDLDVVKYNPNDYIRFEYNATKKDKNINLSDNYVDVKGVPQSRNITIKPFSSIILFKLDQRKSL